MPIGKAKNHATLLKTNIVLSDKRKKNDFLFFERRTAPERRCSSRTFRYGYLVTT